jgi:hypothetical protein
MAQDPSDAKSSFHSVAGISPEDLSRPALTFDPKAYREFVAESGLGRAQEDALLETLWTIVVSFVDLGFELHPVQQIAGDLKLLDEDSADVLAFESISNSTTSLVAARAHAWAVEGVDS